MHEHRNTAMIRRALEIYNSGDHNATRRSLDDDIEWRVGANQDAVDAIWS